MTGRFQRVCSREKVVCISYPHKRITALELSQVQAVRKLGLKWQPSMDSTDGCNHDLIVATTI